MSLVFWTLRLCLGFAVLALLMFSWRASLAVATCLFFDFFGMIAAGASGAGLWVHSQLMLGIGLFLGAVVSVGRPRGNYWDLPLLTVILSVLLSASWIQDRETAERLLRVWPAYLASALALPAGCLCVTSAADLWRRRRVVRRH